MKANQMENFPQFATFLYLLIKTEIKFIKYLLEKCTVQYQKISLTIFLHTKGKFWILYFNSQLETKLTQCHLVYPVWTSLKVDQIDTVPFSLFSLNKSESRPNGTVETKIKSKLLTNQRRARKFDSLNRDQSGTVHFSVLATV